MAKKDPIKNEDLRSMMGPVLMEKVAAGDLRGAISAYLGCGCYYTRPGDTGKIRKRHHSEIVSRVNSEESKAHQLKTNAIVSRLVSDEDMSRETRTALILERKAREAEWTKMVSVSEKPIRRSVYARHFVRKFRHFFPEIRQGSAPKPVFPEIPPPMPVPSHYMDAHQSPGKVREAR